jgi:starvation-inducible DNA-binding protein
LGPHFRDYHRLLNEQAAEILANIEAIAERVRKIGGTTIRSIGHVARLRRIKDNDAEFVSAGEMLAELHHDNLEFVEHLREAKQVADTASDNATAGMLDEWTDQAEKRAWFLFETTRGC